MRFRKLGNTGFDVSLLGFGTWQLGGKRWIGLSDDESIELLRYARQLGINIFDVSTVYGQYQDENGFLRSRSQELLGRAFAGSRETVIYCLKLGQFDEYSHRSNYEPQRIVEHFHRSLRSLRTDYADICLIHAPSLHKVKDGRAITVLQTLQAQGLVKAIGYSFENEPEHVEQALSQNIDVIMLQYNLLESDCGKVIDAATERGVGVLVGGPYKRGYLTGKYLNVSDLPEDDYWAWNKNYDRDKIEQVLRDVKDLLRKYDTPQNLRQEALSFIAQKKGIGSIIVGHRAPQEIGENIEYLARDVHAYPVNCKEQLTIHANLINH